MLGQALVCAERFSTRTLCRIVSAMSSLYIPVEMGAAALSVGVKVTWRKLSYSLNRPSPRYSRDGPFTSSALHGRNQPTNVRARQPCRNRHCRSRQVGWMLIHYLPQ